jgi:hypothetical protein
MAGWLMIAALVGGMTWAFALFGYEIIMWAKRRELERARAKRRQ